MTKGQSEAARAERLDRGCCPTHGLGMSQLCGWFYPSDEPPFTLVDCPRRDCDVICKAWDFYGPYELLTSEQAEQLYPGITQISQRYKGGRQ